MNSAEAITNPKDLARFLRQVDCSGDGCWEWQGRLNRGYGHFCFGGKRKRAARVSWTTFVGSIQSGLTIDHLCRVRWCIKPSHLEIVDSRTNTLRGDGELYVKDGDDLDEVASFDCEWAGPLPPPDTAHAPTAPVLVDEV